MGLAKPLASVSLIPEHGAGSSESIRHVELTGAMEPDEWEIEADELELGPRIGIGSFGEVYRGTWRHTDVAVKKFLEQDLSPQLMQAGPGWHVYKFYVMRPGGLFQKIIFCVDKGVKVSLEQDLSTHLIRVCSRPQVCHLRLGVTPQRSSTQI